MPKMRRWEGERFTDSYGFRWVERKHSEKSLGIVSFECDNPREEDDVYEVELDRQGMLEVDGFVSPEAMKWILSRVPYWATPENLRGDPCPGDEEEYDDEED